MKKIIYILSLSILTSCSLFQTREQNDSPALVTGGTEVNSMTSDELAFHLTRTTTMGGGIYEVSLMPLTTPYLEKHWQEFQSTRALKGEDEKQARKWHVTRFISNKTCVDFHYNVTRFEQMKQLDQWQLTLEVDGDHFPLEWMSESMQSQPFVSEIQTATSPMKRWHNSGVACAPVELPISRGFSIKVQATYVPWPFSSDTSLDWVFKAIRPEDEAAVEERRKKNYQKYRGY